VVILAPGEKGVMSGWANSGDEKEHLSSRMMTCIEEELSS